MPFVLPRRRSLTLVPLCAIALLPSSPAGAQWSVWAPVPYLDVIDRYRSGETADAVAEIGRWPRAHIERSLTELFAFVLAAPEGDPRLEVATLDAALLLHTAVAMQAELAGDARAAGLHISVAAAIADGIEEAARKRPALCGTSRLVTRRDWQLVAAGWQQGRWQLDAAGALFTDLLEAAPGDAEVRLAAGMYEEARHADESRVMTQYGRLSRSPTARGLGDERSVVRMRDEARVRQHLVDAAGHYRQALVADPGLHEARVRLARVEMLRGNAAGADVLLREAREGSREPLVLYLAELFTARRAEASDDLDAAVSAYERARTQLPGAQAARMGLAHAFEQSGRAGDARAVLQSVLSEPAPRPFKADPWWAYQFGYSSHAMALFDRLRARVVRR